MHKKRAADRPPEKRGCDELTESDVAALHFVFAGLVGGRIGFAIVLLDDAIREHVGLDLFATHISQHIAVNLDAGLEHLAGFLNHLLTLCRVVDDVPIFEWQVVFAHHSPNPLTPAAGWLHICDNLWFLHFYTLTGTNRLPSWDGLATFFSK
jgi:hypothetical protein